MIEREDKRRAYLKMRKAGLCSKSEGAHVWEESRQLVDYWESREGFDGNKARQETLQRYAKAALRGSR